MDYKSIEKRLTAAHTIFQSDQLSKSTFDQLQTLLSGIHPKLDTVLASVTKTGKHVFRLQQGDVIELTLESLPEGSEDEKKRKKALLLFLKFWNDLRNETARVEKDLRNDPHHGIRGKTTAWGNILSLAKGPLGIVTAVAAVIAVLKITEVSIVIRNVGCQPMIPMSSVAISILGLKLPAETIPDGGQAVAKLPPFTARVDATAADSVRLSVYGVTYDFSLGSSGITLVFDGENLNGRATDIHLGSQKTHTLSIECGRYITN